MNGPRATAYRPDIDGLRAIAVGGVVVFHALPSVVPGGFTGVDIFFVISGFLISSLLIERLEQHRFSITDFYLRRVRRIFPALIAMLLVVSAAAWFILLPDEFRDFGATVGGGAAFVANVVLWRQSGYFDETAELKPLLHLWSLGIEEQFYILWPIGLFLLWRLHRGRLALLLAAVVLSFAFNVLRVKNHAVPTFYLLPSRAWELGVGGILAYVTVARDWHAAGRAGLSTLLSLAGAACLVAAYAAIDRETVFPGWAAVLPVAGAALLIAAGPMAPVNRWLLSRRGVVYVGLISYPLYLWHWPLLAFARLLTPGDVPQSSVVFGAIGLAILLAVVTYHFIELPIRHGPGARVAPPLVSGLAMAAIVGVAMMLGAFRPRSDTPEVEAFLRQSQEVPPDELKLEDLLSSEEVVKVGPGAQGRVFFFGDSQAAQLYPRVDWLETSGDGTRPGAAFLTGGGCVPILGIVEARHTWCQGLAEKGMEYARSPEVHTVVFVAGWYRRFVTPDDTDAYLFEDESGRHDIMPLGSPGWVKALDRLESMIRALRGAGKDVAILLPVPVGDSNAPRQIIARRFGDLSFRIEPRPLDRERFEREMKPFRQRLDAIVRNAGATLIDPDPTLCDERHCPVVDANGRPIYRDGGHLRPTFVRDQARFVDSLFASHVPELAAGRH